MTATLLFLLFFGGTTAVFAQKSDSDIEKIGYKNAWRVWNEVEKNNFSRRLMY